MLRRVGDYTLMSLSKEVAWSYFYSKNIVFVSWIETRLRSLRVEIRNPNNPTAVTIGAGPQ